jgi:UDP-2-acetamido-3-amino-2,3-dideoxy-glucuronate N-acetyltransferase
MVINNRVQTRHRLPGTIRSLTRKNIALVGAGYWGRHLVRNFYELGGLHTVCDSNPQTIAQFNGSYPDIGVETDYGRVLANPEIDGVVIATPAELHYDMARQALRAGKDVFVEKPLAFTVREGEQLVRLAEQEGRILMVGHLLEYHPAVIKLKELINTGELGKINYIYSSRLNLGKFRTEENILWSFAPHDISVILLLLDEMPRQVSAHGGQYLNQGVADVTVTTMSFKGDTRAHIFVSWLHPYKEQKLIVIGDKKMAVFDDVSPENKLCLYEHRIQWHHRVPVPDKKEAIQVEIAMEEPLRLECRHFMDCMASRQKPRTSGDKGLKVLRVLEACQKSLQAQGGSISLSSSGFYVHPSSLVERPDRIGEGTSIWHYSHVMPDVTIGRNCNIGQNVFIAGNVRIGDNVKIQNNVSVFEGVILEDDVFCGPSCVFTNVKMPRSHRPQRGNYAATTVRKGATIGANATIVCGITIGEYAFIGAGAVVTHDVPDYALVYGNPARINGWLCNCGEKLDFNGSRHAKCVSCGRQYEVLDGERIAERAGL